MHNRIPSALARHIGTPLLAVCLCPLLFAQEATFDWAQRVEGPAPSGSVLIAADGRGNVFVGSQRSTTPSSKLSKLDSRGALLWGRTLNTLGNQGVTTDADGACYVIGYALTNAFGGVGVTSTGSGNAFIIKFSPDGAWQWVRREGGAQTAISSTTAPNYGKTMDSLYTRAVKVDALGNLYLAGDYLGNVNIGGTTLPPTGLDYTFDRRMFLAKYSKDGAPQWVRTEDANISMGDIALDATGSILVSGEHTALDGDRFVSDGFLMKYDKDGTVLWSQPSVSANGFFSSSLAIDQEGSAFVLAFPMVDGSWAMDLSKWSSNGEQLWERQYQPDYLGNNGGIAVDKQGNCFVTGSYFGGAQFDAVTIQTDAYYQSFVLKFTGSGELRWAVSSQGLDPMVGNRAADASDARDTRLAIDPAGACYLAGLFAMRVQFGATILAGPNPVNGYQLFVARITDSDAASQDMRLNIARETDGLWLTWPASAAGFTLQSTSSPTDPASWVTLISPPVSTGDQNSVKVDVSDAPTFYRLIKE
jgi:hypothetical protein